MKLSGTSTGNSRCLITGGKMEFLLRFSSFSSYSGGGVEPELLMLGRESPLPPPLMASAALLKRLSVAFL